MKFVYPKRLLISSMKPSLNRTTFFKIIVHEIELHAAFEEKFQLCLLFNPFQNGLYILDGFL